MRSVLANVTCVSVEGRGLLIRGIPGSGKSSLALALIDRGATLIGDDGVTLMPESGALVASPPPNIAGLIEIRNVGLVRMPVTSAPLALVIALDTDAPRFPAKLETTSIGSHSLPLIQLDPRLPQLALRAEWALRVHGLTPGQKQ